MVSNKAIEKNNPHVILNCGKLIRNKFVQFPVALMRFELFMAVKMWIMIFWVVTLLSLLGGCQPLLPSTIICICCPFSSPFSFFTHSLWPPFPYIINSLPHIDSFLP